MNVQDLIRSAKCCDLKDCNDCPSRSSTACRERIMQGLSCEVERLQRMAVRESSGKALKWPMLCETFLPSAKRRILPFGLEKQRNGTNG